MSGTSISSVEILGILQLEQHNIGALNMPNMPSFMDLVQDAVSGQLDLSFAGLVNIFQNIVFQELLVHGQLIRQLLIIAIIGALMSVLTEAFTHKGASETGFYVTYLMAVLLAVSAFYLSVDILTGLMDVVNTIMLASVPMMAGLMTMGGNFVGAAGINPMLFFALHIITLFISTLFIPLVMAAAGLEIASRLSSDGARLEMLSDITSKLASWTLKSIVAVFMFILTLQRITAPIISNVAIQTSRNIAGSVPVVGGAFTSAIDTVVTFSQAARSGVMVALVLVLCGALLVPLIKILVLAAIYRVVAAFLQPIADKRLVGLMAGAGKYMMLMFSGGALVGVMCIYTVVLLLSF